MKVPAHALCPGQTIWLNPGRAGVPRTVELVKPDDHEVSIVLEPVDLLPRAQLRAPATYKFELAETFTEQAA